ncbi:MAG: phage baseplate assembly protein V [Ferruginibacter sp.]
MAFQLPQIKIKVEGTDGDIIFSNLVINQYLADVNAFNFTWRQPEGEATLANHINFYKKNLSKEVTIRVDSNFTFKGIIYAINCNNQDTLGVSYEIIGKGLFVKLDEVPECVSFFKQPLSKILEKVNKAQGTTLKATPKNDKELFYTVQYNQTGFEFYRMMAARQGEWLYYNGTELVMGEPESESLSLKQNEDIFDLDITAKLVKAPQKIAGFDHYKGKASTNEPATAGKGGGFMEASVKAGENAYGTNHANAYFTNAATPDLLKDIGKLKQQSAAASSVFLTARSFNSKIKLAGKIKIQDEKGGNGGEYIITEIHHSAITDNNYQNQFVAVPAEVEVPPYTNPSLYPLCKPQAAIVVNNEDEKGMDRIKVRFPWQDSKESTPWINVLTPHAGKDKGMRFLPEIDEEVLVGFQDNNAERPFVMGAVHTEQHKSGNDHKANNLKVLGTKTGRRIEIDDDKGYMSLADNYTKDYPKNAVYQKRKDSDTTMEITSFKGEKDFSKIILKNKETLHISVSQGSALTEIMLDANSKKITITSKGDVEVIADGKIDMKAKGDIIMEAKGKMNLKGTMGIEIAGMKMALKADTTMDVKGMTTTVEGSAKADFKGGMMASITAALVKIN